MTFPLSEIFFGGPDGGDATSGGRVPSGRRLHVVAGAAQAAGETLSAADAALVDGIRAGDVQLFETLVRDYSSVLTRFAYDFLRTPEGAEDLVADLLLWLWEHRAEWSVRGSVRGYLFGAVRNRALNARRANSTRAAWRDLHAGDTSAAGIANEQLDSVALLEAGELGALVRRAVDQLPERRRTVVILRWMHGMSYTEIADATGSTVVGVKQQLNRALRALREALPEHVR
jgi:RNA polymerase sigma-70 factor (ECF subfamily)